MIENINQFSKEIIDCHFIDNNFIDNYFIVSRIEKREIAIDKMSH